ncbi:hypothetical protein DFH29DRAFT_932677 [Suillus ampliporus]|nr:hypothetical protein DFH29DRAFT_932677 [Suillus ampliporus]
MIYNFIKNVVNSLLGCSLVKLLYRQQARIESGLHRDLHSRRSEVPSCVGRSTLEDIPEELRCHILGFLSCNEIIRCALTCRTMFKTVKTSVELQYVIELGFQRLIQCLRILRKKAKAWNSFELNPTKLLSFTTLFDSNTVAHGQLMCSSFIEGSSSHNVDAETHTTCTAHFWMNRANPPLRTFRYKDDLQDLEITIKLPIDVDTHGFKYQIFFRTISTGEEHPLVRGSSVLTGRVACGEALEFKIFVSVHGDRVAVCVVGFDEDGDSYWSLHVWSWQQGGRADDICVMGEGNELYDIHFLTNEKLLGLTSDGHIELYDVEDLSKAPQLQARFILPVHTELGAFRHPSVFHSAASCAHLKTHDHWIWTTNPADRVISVVWVSPSSAFVISARIFFMDIPPTWFDATSKDGRSVPWSSWGKDCAQLGMGGSRVVWVTPDPDDASSSQLHMADFNPSAVARGIGNVVRKPTTSTGLHPDTQVTTYLPFVEVVRECDIDGFIWDVVLDEKNMVILTEPAIESEWKMDANFFDM